MLSRAVHGKVAEWLKAPDCNSGDEGHRRFESYLSHMPQLDLVTYLSQFFWLLVGFLGFYYASVKFFLPRLGRLLALRAHRQGAADTALSQPSALPLEQVLEVASAQALPPRPAVSIRLEEGAVPAVTALTTHQLTQLRAASLEHFHLVETMPASLTLAATLVPLRA
jgi:hypothetical protein